jgi:hypothetical protein
VGRVVVSLLGKGRARCEAKGNEGGTEDLHESFSFERLGCGGRGFRLCINRIG